MSDDSGDVRDLLRAAADGPPPVRIDVTAVLAEGDRVVRRRRVGRALAVVATSVAVAGAVTAVPLLRPDHLGSHVGVPAGPGGSGGAPTNSGAPPEPTRGATSGPGMSPPVPGDGTDLGTRLTMALTEVLPLPAAHLTGVGSQEPLVFYPSDDGYTARADIRDRDGQGSITVVVKPMTTSNLSIDPCDGQEGDCVASEQNGARLAVVDTSLGWGAHRWKVVAWRSDSTVVVVEGTNWSEQERQSKHVDATEVIRRNDAPLTTNQMIKVATATGMYWG